MKARHITSIIVSKDGLPITPVVTSWLARKAEYHITYWTTTYSAEYVIKHGFIFAKTTSFFMYSSDEYNNTLVLTIRSKRRSHRYKWYIARFKERSCGQRCYTHERNLRSGSPSRTLGRDDALVVPPSRWSTQPRNTSATQRLKMTSLESPILE